MDSEIFSFSMSVFPYKTGNGKSKIFAVAYFSREIKMDSEVFSFSMSVFPLKTGNGKIKILVVADISYFKLQATISTD